MTEEQLKVPNKAMKRAKRIATERAGKLEYLVENRLPVEFDQIPGMAQTTCDACKARSATAAYGAA